MNFFDYIKENGSELEETIYESGYIKIIRIVSSGETTDFMESPMNEHVFLVQGEAKITYEDGREITMSSGDYILIGKNTRHRVSYTSSEPHCLWHCIYEKV